MEQRGGRCQAFREELGEIYYYKGGSKNWTMQNYHYHDTCEIILFLSDGNTVDVGQSTYQTSYGDMMLFRSGEPHRVNPSDDTFYKRYVLMFDPEVVRRMVGPLSYNYLRYFENQGEDFIHRLSLSGQALQSVIALMDRIDPLYSTRLESKSRAMIYLLVAELLIMIQDLFDFFQKEEPHSDPPQRLEDFSFEMHDNNKVRILQIKQYICDHIEEKLTLGDIAGKFFISKYYLSHYFKKETGFSIMQYITMQKMIQAKKMLRRGSSIRHVAITLGYNSDSHFISTFQKHVGKTPKRYASDSNHDKNQ